MRGLAVTTALSIVLVGCSSSQNMTTASTTTKKVDTPKTIVDIAAGNPAFSTLVTALKSAELVDTLKMEGPYTVFAPTDEAFAKLPKGTVEALLADKQKLTQILTYHVVPDRVLAEDVASLTEAPTLQGQKLTISSRAGVKIDKAKVVTTDIMASNGVIHVIDTVLIPN